jgi:cholesterol 7-dehydrogenase
MELTNSIIDFLKRDELFWPLLICSGLAIYLVYYCIFRNPHYLIKCKYNTKKKNIGRPPPPFPNGWYNICFSHELPVKNVKSADIAGQNIVLYRGEDNLPYALDAYCLHMGAHMGEGGQVINKNCIQCPFHGWLYDGSTGQCVGNDRII